MLSIRNSEIYLVILLPIIALLNLVDFVDDYQQEVDTHHLPLELAQVIAVIIAIGLLLKQIYKRQEN